ncbi:Secreted protein concanavalin A-like lectin/glucanase [Candidatus Sulfotelmatomonas gaucii]|uniref:Secreted protein concanavalin A-like lectin/glucanase n=1 Tax=Candidatus Sulfuritelmatomonas gaucii TaxID=2043161 RepID=A0A2N9L2A3_9BACT|nr:Secreted protein concanavalin A-like lectin/glucanase [Candidatus Sulfotelmatomonas gaucii]
MYRSRQFSLLCVFAAIAIIVFVSPARSQVALEHAPPDTTSILPPNPHASEPGLLFYLSGDHGFNADYAAGGNPVPNYLHDVTILPNGVSGSYIQCGNSQLLSYWAPGNIYSQRGTLSFFWRSRDPLDETEFPVFRVGFADHSSWDMVWLRIDWNGHGFDAFVTDVNLGRTRVSVKLPEIPRPDQWLHLALAWDETSGIRFYIDGKLMATREATGLFDTALDQLGSHSRIIGPTGVESSYSYDRGGDIDELRIYDRMLSDDNIAGLAKNQIPQDIPPLNRKVATGPSPNESAAAIVPSEGQYDSGSGHATDWQQEWNLKYGWNRPGDDPVLLNEEYTTVRKVEIHDVYDLDRWWWKATDGIRETTWPGVYNRSRIIGRDDYFELPDWDCYSLSGKTVTFYMPDEPWNHFEIEGGAWGTWTLLAHDREKAADSELTLFVQPIGQEVTYHQLDAPITGQKVRFVNVEQEQPLGEVSAYFVHPGMEPTGVDTLRYRLTSSANAADNPSTVPLVNYVEGRFPADERTTMMAMPAAGPGPGPRSARRQNTPSESAPAGLPIVHILIPADFRSQMAGEGHGSSYGWENMDGGLDGIAIDLPPLRIQPDADGVIPLNIQVKDPLWPMRNMLYFTFAVKPGTPHTLWLDTRDRILPNGKSLYITIAAQSADFSTAALEGAEVRLIFKPYRDALHEDVSDRLTQVRDEFANLVEESVSSRRLNLFNRFDADITDLLRVDPENTLARDYWHEMNHEQARPPFILPQAPPGVPQWAFLQVEDLGYLKRLINWYIDNRQISNGEFGGGLSDDSDFTEWWPGLALMGSTPEKIKASLWREMDAMYAQHMFTNGLATIQTDELHSYEDGLNVLSESMFLDFGSPKQIERAMVTAKRLEWLTGINDAGHRHVRSNYFNGAKMATGGVWGWSKESSYMDFHPALSLVLFNGMPETRKMILELADGILAHYKPGPDGRKTLHLEVNFKTDEDKPTGMRAWFILWAAYRWTGDPKYVQPFVDSPVESLGLVNADMLDMLNLRKQESDPIVAAASRVSGPTGIAQPSETLWQLAWQVTGDRSYLDKVYASQIQTAHEREFINTQGSLWIDRIYFNNGELQRSRLGGVALMRNYCYPGNAVSWRFDAPADDQSVAILVPEATPDHVKIIAYNLDRVPVTAQMTGWEVDPGEWTMTQGTQTGIGTAPPATDAPVQDLTTKTVPFERSKSVTITFAPRTTTVIELTLKNKGVPYWSRPDLGIDPEDVKVSGSTMTVTVHSVGAVDAPASKVVLRDKAGKTLATADVPVLKAPLDLMPKTAQVTLEVPVGADLKGAKVTVECGGDVPEITLMNNSVTL